jgi:hypothetical protein
MTSEDLTEISVSIADLKENLMAGDETLMDKIEDIELNAIADQREAEPFKEVCLDDL